MTPADFEARVNELLDDRRDPLSDDACVEFLAADPARLDRYIAAHERLAALPPSAKEPRRVALRLTVAAAVAASVFVLWRLTAAEAHSDVGRGRVLAASAAPVSWNPGAATPAHARSVLLASRHARLEVFEQW